MRRLFRTGLLWIVLASSIGLSVLPSMASADRIELDTGFGNDGYSVGEGLDVLSPPEVFPQPGGGLLVSDRVGDIDRLDAQGNPDPWGRFDYPVRTWGWEPYTEDIALQGKKIIAAGWFSETSADDPTFEYQRRFIYRLTTRSRIDRSFGHRGRIPAKWDGQGSVFKDIEVTEDGKILAAGGRGIAQNPNPEAVATITRYRPNGALDRSFAEKGTFYLTRRGSPDSFREFDTILEAGGGGVLAAGYNGDRTVVVKLTKNGKGTAGSAGETA